MNNKTTT